MRADFTGDKVMRLGVFVLLVGVLWVRVGPPAFGDGLSSVAVPEANVALRTGGDGSSGVVRG